MIAALVGLVTGIGVGVFRVHPLIMTLGMGLVVLGLANVWQLADGPDRRRASRPSCGRSGRARSSTSCRYSLLVFVPVAAIILLGLRRTGYGRLLYAIGDNPIAARLSGARVVAGPRRRCTSSRRSWPAIAGFLYSGLTNVASVTLADSSVLPSVAAAVIGGTSIMGGRGGYGGTIVGALILTVAHRAPDRRSACPRRSARSCSGRSSSSSPPPTPG